MNTIENMKAKHKLRELTDYPICKLCGKPIESKPERGAIPKHHKICYQRLWQAKKRKADRRKVREYDKLLRQYTDLQQYCEQLQTKVICMQEAAHGH